MISVRSNKYLEVLHSEHEQIDLMPVHIYPTVLVEWLCDFVSRAIRLAASWVLYSLEMCVE